MKIRPLRPEDIKSASKIVGKNYSKKYEKSSFIEMEAMFKNFPVKPQYLVAEDKTGIIGFAGYMQSWMDYNVYSIFWVNVPPSHQGKGIGTVLIERVIRIIKRKKAKMVILTTSKPRFYSERF